MGKILSEGDDKMEIKTWALTLGVGAAVGAVAIMMMPRQSYARQMAYRAAAKVEDAATMMADKITHKIDSMT
jgi:hypothetical protein